MALRAPAYAAKPKKPYKVVESWGRPECWGMIPENIVDRAHAMRQAAPEGSHGEETRRQPHNKG
jgi:hypothetical protein